MSLLARMDPPGTAAGWWKAPGAARCSCCEQPHQIEAMLFCCSCDGPVCAVCVLIGIDREPGCPACLASAGDA